MILLYILVSATLLVQNIHSADAYENNAENFEEYRRMAPSKSEFTRAISNMLSEVRTPLQQLKRDIKSKRVHNKRKSKSFSHKKPHWDKWTDWSACSVTCGKGREIRWRHCLKHCDGLETEMEEKTCQLPNCGGKLFGIINL